MNNDKLKQAFLSMYSGKKEDIRIFKAPGRVNLIGEHTDYNGGFVFPIALDMTTTIAVRKNGTSSIRLAATDLPDRVTLDINNLDNYRNLPWGNYQAGVFYVMQNEGCDIFGYDLLYEDTVPHGAGLSSSAAIEVATALLAETFSKEAKGDSTPSDMLRLALLSQRAENEYCGVACGIMDQFASAMGKKGNAIFLDCKDLSYRYVPINLSDHDIVIANTNKKRGLADSKYNERRKECETALELLKKAVPDAMFLRDISAEQFEKHKSLIKNDTIRVRAQHVIYECDRVQKSVDALSKNNLFEFGRLMTESHLSLKKLYEVTGQELDIMVEEALKQDGCLGSRMTGAGFGGCTVSMVEKAKTEDFIDAVGKGYNERTSIKPDFYITKAGDGAREII